MKLIRGCLLAVVVFGCLANAQIGTKPQKPYQPPRPQPKEPQRPQPPTKPQEPQRPHPPTKPQVPLRPHPHPKPQEPQKPHPHPKPQEPLVPTPPDLRCDVGINDRIPCGAPDITQFECEAINCCSEGRMCYYGKGVTLQCTKAGYFIVVISKDVTLPSIDMGSIYFYGGGDECQPAGITPTFLIYMFRVTACGTLQFDEPDGLLYENWISSTYEIIGGKITRDTTFDVVIQCRYIGSSTEALVIEVNTLPSPYPVAALGPIHVVINLGSGQCTVKGCVEGDVAFNSYYSETEYPITKVLRDPVYVEVKLVEMTDPYLVLTLGRCWATVGSNPHSYPQWDLLIDGCPNYEDNYQTRLLKSFCVPYPAYCKRFVFWMFTFMTAGMSEPSQKMQSDSPPSRHPSKELIYIHCSTTICIPTPFDNCEVPCLLRKKREIAASAVKKPRRETIIVSSKAIEMRSA
ncbi:zona pellucida sperm-binding protein 4-like [Takifugu flavidus]|uniref:Zona pellucida sperm-binding protein 4 n=1 Tax=Takifugu flavidus TaxID=433684 RepID=A0A5C6P9N2_9TELE|nr:zona pellucida sperm-binding protein 4-like [Takifugu flavidus]TWW76442.1 Zona pellucida sperm-binding protein 4 RC55 [Takifugu flavidus]